MNRYNLFRFATKELSHSAFWGWIFQTVDSEGDTLEGPKTVARKALRKLEAPLPDEDVTVETEVPFPSGDRPDIKVELDSENALFVELKKSASFREQQIKGYEEAIGDGEKVVLISTRYDAGEAKSVCPYLGLEDIREIVSPHRDSHPLLADYAEWIDKQVEQRNTISGNAFSEDPEEVEEALSTLYGQKQVMEAVTEEMDGRWKQSQSNLGGDPYTEFRFVEADSDQDALFYRIDEYSAGYYISLKQYLGSRDMDAWEGKEDRLERLRQWWNEAKQAVDHDLSFRDPHNRGSKTCEVGCLLFKHNPPSRVAEDLPQVHEAFVSRLEENGWNLEVEK